MCGLLLCDIHESLCRGYHRTDFSNLVTTLLLRPHRNWYYYQNDFPIQFSLFIGLLTIWRLATCIYIRGKRQRHVNPIYSVTTNIIMMEQEWTDSMYPFIRLLFVINSNWYPFPKKWIAGQWRTKRRVVFTYCYYMHTHTRPITQLLCPDFFLLPRMVGTRINLFIIIHNTY